MRNYFEWEYQSHCTVAQKISIASKPISSAIFGHIDEVTYDQLREDHVKTRKEINKLRAIIQTGPISNPDAGLMMANELTTYAQRLEGIDQITKDLGFCLLPN